MESGLIVAMRDYRALATDSGVWLLWAQME
jgi:hypothetical protein